MTISESLSSITKRFFPEKHHLAVRNAYLRARTKAAPLLRLVYGTFDAAALCRHIESKIGTDFDCLMVHSSVNKLAPTYTQGPLELVRALIDFVGPQRTLAMPGFFFGDPRIGGLVDTLKANPEFDMRRTPSQMGLATELFRRSPGVRCSRHPIYRVCALGPLAERITTGHEHAGTNCGVGTPFDAMTQVDTWILGIGKPIDVLTQVHHAEDLMGDDFPVPRSAKRNFLEIQIKDGSECIPYRLPGGGVLWRRNMWRLRKLMDKETLREWTFHNVPMFAVRAADVSHALVAGARQGLTIYERPQNP